MFSKVKFMVSYYRHIFSIIFTIISLILLFKQLSALFSSVRDVFTILDEQSFIENGFVRARARD